jgi:hypothetical protein
MSAIYWIIAGLVVFFAVAGFLLRRRFKKTWENEMWADIATILSGIGVVFSFVWAAYNVDQGERLDRELAALNLYQEHMKLSMDNAFSKSEFAPPLPECDDSPETKKAFNKYRWYVGHAMFSFESIVSVSKGDTAWNSAISCFICGHKRYILSKYFPADRYPVLEPIITDVRTGQFSCEIKCRE